MPKRAKVPAYNETPHKIRKLREKYGMSQRRFGEKVGVSAKTVCAYEKGLCVPSNKVLDIIAERFNYPGIYIVSDNNSKAINLKIKEITERISEIYSMLNLDTYD